MKTIEERAKQLGVISEYRADYPYDKTSVEFGYMRGATEQKAIDIEKACEWLGVHLAEVADRYDSTANLLLRLVRENFRKAMEKEL